jgi:hypothetical protein
MSENLQMWDYWLDKRGSASDAIEADYPELLNTNWELQVAVTQVKANQLLIDSIMRQLSEEKDATTRTDENLTYSLFG